MRTLSLLVMFLTGCGAADFIENPMLDRWCGDRPCAWDHTGKVARVGTWHTDDYAVELLGDDVTLSQVNEQIDWREARCLGFSMIADIDRQAQVFVELDFLNDGAVEFSQRIPELHWERRTFVVMAPSWYEGVRFIVRKSGPGRVVLAELRSKQSYDCRGPAVALLERPDGRRCDSDDQCQSRRCRFDVCSYCASDDECGPDMVCGATGGESYAERCVAKGSANFGETCSSDAQCASGICCEGACSQCCADRASCEDELECARSKEFTNPHPLEKLQMPFQCAPGEGKTLMGGPCVMPSDCQSGSCSGSSVECVEPAFPKIADAGVAGDFPAIITCPLWQLHGGTCI